MNERKLAIFAGFTWHDYQIFESEYTNTRIEDPYWEYPNGRKCRVLPDFSKIGEGVKWLMPKLQLPIITLELDPECDGSEYWCCRIQQRDSYGKIITNTWGNGNTLGLAFHGAIEQLVDSREELT